jgi:hypothetical protein
LGVPTPNGWEGIKEETKEHADQARTEAYRQFKALHDGIGKDANKGYAVKYDDAWTNRFGNPTRKQSQLHEDHVNRALTIDYHHDHEDDYKHVKNLNDAIGEYSSLYPHNHIEEDYKGVDFGPLHTIDRKHAHALGNIE